MGHLYRNSIDVEIWTHGYINVWNDDANKSKCSLTASMLGCAQILANVMVAGVNAVENSLKRTIDREESSSQPERGRDLNHLSICIGSGSSKRTNKLPRGARRDESIVGSIGRQFRLLGVSEVPMSCYNCTVALCCSTATMRRGCWDTN